MILRGFIHAGRPNLRRDDQQHASASDAPNGARAISADDAESYRLVSIDVSHAPEGCTGENWFVYRITQGKNGITGYRCGSLERVSADVQSIVTSLNGRRYWAKTKTSSERQRRAIAAARRAAK